MNENYSGIKISESGTTRREILKKGLMVLAFSTAPFREISKLQDIPYSPKNIKNVFYKVLNDEMEISQEEYIKENVENGRIGLAKVLQEYTLETLEYKTEEWIRNNFQNSNQRYGLEKALERAKPYIPSLKHIFLQNGIPEEEIFISIIESRFLNQISPRGARGAFQLMRQAVLDHTQNDKEMVSDTYDLRDNPLLGGEIAAKVLKHNLDITKDLDLARAAYNSPFVWHYRREGGRDFEGYLAYLGKRLENRPQDFKFIDETIQFMVGNEGLKRSLKKKYASFFNMPASDELFKIHDLSTPDFEYIVKSGDGLNHISNVYLTQTFGISTNVGIQRTTNWMQNKKGIKKIVHPNQKIKIKSPKNLRDIAYLTGKELGPENSHIKNPNTLLPKNAKIVIPLTS